MPETRTEAITSTWVTTGRWRLGSLEQSALEYPHLLEEPFTRMNLDHVEAVLGEREWSRMTGFAYAGLAAILHAYGARPSRIEFAAGEGGSVQAQGATPATPASLLALALGQQAAVSIYLDRAYLHDPHRVMASWAMAGNLFAAAQRSVPTTAFLCGADARTPEDWDGRAVHLDHIRGRVFAYLEEYWEQVAQLAAHLAENGCADEAALGAALEAQAAPVPALGPEDPMFQATPVDPRAIAATAGYWAEQMRARLAAEDAAGERSGNPPVSSEQVDRFRAALEHEINVLIERRTQQNSGGLECTVTRRETGHLVYVVGLSGYDVSPVLGTAMTAAGLDPVELYASAIRPVELGHDGAFAEREDGLMYPLWTPSAQSPA